MGRELPFIFILPNTISRLRVVFFLHPRCAQEAPPPSSPVKVMAYSDDEGELMLGVVTNYHFEDEKEEPICFSILPVQWCEGGSLDAPKGRVFLHGKTDNGLQKIYTQVMAWKVKIEGVCPEIWVLSKDRGWLKLLKPRKAYEGTIRKILITLQCLFYLKRKPTSSGISLWEHVQKVFSQFEVRASEYDLLGHLTFIQAMVEKDEMLSKSQLLFKYLHDLPKRKASSVALKRGLHADEKVLEVGFTDDDEIDEYDVDVDADNSDGDECFDTVCTICDNGGEVLCCEGVCLRSFHATKDTGVDSCCKTLGYTWAQVRDIPSFRCLNCLHEKHQCFACGKLGNSNKDSHAEVYQCISAACGHFYHPHCAARLIHPDNEAKATELAENIAVGIPFTCSIHKCVVCKRVEVKKDKELQFAMCRRCPKSYHRKCLPRRISFEDVEEEGIVQRAWDDLIPNRILIYCLKHKIDKTIGTPMRNHIIFPGTSEQKFAHPPVSSNAKVLVKRKADDLSGEEMSKRLERMAGTLPNRVVASNKVLVGPMIDSSAKPQTSDIPKSILKDRVKKGSVTMERKMSMRDERKTSCMPVNELETCKSLSRGSLSSEVSTVVPSGKKFHSPSPSIDHETRQRIMLLVKRSPSSSWTVEDLLKKKQIPTTYEYVSSRVDKTITQGKVDASIQAIREALQKIENGCSIEDAKAVCGPDIIRQMFRWKNKLKVYLAPFIHGLRYTSYGRHFTKVDKLKEIVERLHWYVQNGDMIVDFCCGANDFSILMKEKLEATGKKCLFRNYDVFQAKNDFNFERRDWMKVHPKELPTGSQLIMGLNPPFGVKAALANKFIDKALEFKPKLLILVVPKETKRLDEKPAAYDLIWVDERELAGKSFYLPGSVDVDDKQLEQWNLKPPPLYLWSRPDWTAKHKAIATKHGHTYSVPDKSKWRADKEFLARVHLTDYHDYYGIQSRMSNDAPDMQKDWAEEFPEKVVAPYGQADSRRLENVNDGKDRCKVARSDIEDCETKTGKSFCTQRRSKELEEEFVDRIADDLSDMDISPPHQSDQQHLFVDRFSFEAHTERTTAMDSFQSRASLLRMTYAGVPNDDLPAQDHDNMEQRYDASSRKSFSSSPYGLTIGAGNLSDDIHGTAEQFPRNVSCSPIGHFDPPPVIGGEGPLRPDKHIPARMCGQLDLHDSSSGLCMSGAQTGSFSLPCYGLPSSAFGLSTMRRYDHPPADPNYAEKGPSVYNNLPPLGDGTVNWSSPSPGSQNLLPGHGSSCGWLDE